MINRILDIVLAGSAAVVLSPLALPLMVALRCTGEGEVFYRQERVGRGGRTFALLKFATMLKDSPRIGAGEITLQDDPRILPLGHFLRKSKLNELPQLWNILKGDMSIVGPRPMVPRTFAAYPAAARAAISAVRPGLTGVGSVVFRDEERYLRGEDASRFYQEVIIPYKSSLEEWYLERQGLRMYLAVIAATAWAVLAPRSDAALRLLGPLPAPPAELAG